MAERETGTGGGDAAAAALARARRRAANLARDRERYGREVEAAEARIEEARRQLALAPRVEEALEKLSGELFARMVKVLEENLTIALQEVLEQPIRLRAEANWKYKIPNVEFTIERDGETEDILKGQGGSVANVLSVGLRMFALTTLDPARHRRFLVLDEQDCWLRPDLVPRLVKIIRDAGKALGFQVIVISHHDIAAFERFADRIYRFAPKDGGVEVSRWDPGPAAPDRSE
jgi:DNA repair exonuclease SbcCD ATPase subunit